MFVLWEWDAGVEDVHYLCAFVVDVVVGFWFVAVDVWCLCDVFVVGVWLWC